MQWVRINRRFGAWCALAAIVLQIVVSVSHAHRIEGLRPGGVFQPTAAIPAWTVAEREDPASQPGNAAVEYCAICTILTMAAAAVPPEAPAWGVPVLASEVRLAPHADAAVRTLEHPLFQARAPPSV